MNATEYTVTWTIQVDAEGPWEAAEEAHRLVTKPGTTANVYTCQAEGMRAVTVDLTEGTVE